MLEGCTSMHDIEESQRLNSMETVADAIRAEPETRPSEAANPSELSRVNFLRRFPSWNDGGKTDLVFFGTFWGLFVACIGIMISIHASVDFTFAINDEISMTSIASCPVYGSGPDQGEDAVFFVGGGGAAEVSDKFSSAWCECVADPTAYPTYDLVESYEYDGSGGGGRRRRRRRTLRQLQEEPDYDEKHYLTMFELMQKHVEVPVVGSLAVLALCVGWLLSLWLFGEFFALATVMLTIFGLFALGGYFMYYGALGLAWMPALFGALGLAWFIRNKQRVSFAGKMLKSSSESLWKNPTIFATTLPVQAVLVAYIFLIMNTWIASLNHWTVFAFVERTYDQQTGVESTTHAYCGAVNQPPFWLCFVLGLGFVWAACYVNSVKTLVVACTVSNWTLLGPMSSARMSLKSLLWAFSTSSPTLSVASFLGVLAENIKRAVQRQRRSLWMLNPFSCLIVIIGTCLKTMLETVSRFAVVAHALTAKPFYGSAKTTYHTLKGHLHDTLASDIITQRVVTFGAFVLSLLMGGAMWAWIDAAEGLGSLDFGSINCTDTVTGEQIDGCDENVGKWVIISCVWVAALLAAYPYRGLLVMILLQQVESLNDLTDGKIQGIWTFCFCTIVCHLVFSFIGSLVLDAVDTFALLHAAEKKRTSEGAAPVAMATEVKDVYILFDEELVKAQALLGTTTNTTAYPVVTTQQHQPPTVVAVAAPVQTTTTTVYAQSYIPPQV